MLLVHSHALPTVIVFCVAVYAMPAAAAATHESDAVKEARRNKTLATAIVLGLCYYQKPQIVVVALHNSSVIIPCRILWTL